MFHMGHTQEKKDSIITYKRIDSLSFIYYQNINKNPKASLIHAKEAFSFFHQINDTKRKFNVASNFATALFINNQYEKALSVLDKASTLNLADKEKALYYTLRGLVENDLSHISEAELHYRKALELYTTLDDKDNEFNVLNNLGLLYNNIGNYKKSLEVYLKCYDIMTSLKTDIDRYKYFLNIGTVNYNLNDYENALKSYNSALYEADKKDDSLRIYKAYEKIAQTNLALDSLVTALEYYKKTLKAYKQLGLKKDMSSILLQLGNIYYSLGEKETSLNYFKESKNISNENAYIQEEAEAMLKIGIYYQDQKDNNQAEFYFKKVIKKEPQVTNLEIIKSSYSGLYQIKKRQNKIKESLVYLEKQIEFDKIIRQKRLVNEQDQIEARFTLKKKELELDNLKINYQLNTLQLENQKQKVQSLITFVILTIIVLILILAFYFQKRKAEQVLAIQNKKINLQNEKLVLTNKEIKAKRKELIGLNKIKDQLLSIIAHDVKTPITNLYNLLTILRNHLDSLTKTELQKNLTVIETSTSNLLHFLNNILNWIINQSSGVQVKISYVSINDLIKTNLKLLESSIISKNITIIPPSNQSNKTIKSDLNIIDFALRNILSNAVKYTNSDGYIQINIKETHNKLIQIRVIDSGIGLKEDIHNLLKSNTERVQSFLGTNKEEGYGIGLSLCKKMLAHIDSEILYEENKPSGSIFILQLKPM